MVSTEPVDAAAEARKFSRSLAKTTGDTEKVILEVQALYDYDLPAVTVVFFWWPRAWVKEQTRIEYMSLREHAFSLTKRMRVSSSAPNAWWQVIRLWIADEAVRQGFGFSRRCTWLQLNAPGTYERATKAHYPVAVENKIADGTWFPPPRVFLDLRFSTTKPVLPKWGTEITDRTPNDFRGHVTCGEDACGGPGARAMRDHQYPDDPCPGFQDWLRAKREWRVWYTKTMGAPPIEDGRHPG